MIRDFIHFHKLWQCQQALAETKKQFSQFLLANTFGRKMFLEPEGKGKMTAEI